MKKLLILIAVVMLFAAGTARADIAYTGSIATWNQQGQPGTQTSTVGAGSSHITSIDMTRNGGLTANAGVNSLNSAAWTSGGYVQFGFTVDQGYQAALGNLYFGSKVSATGPTSLVIKTSADNFGTAFQTIAMNNGVTGTPYINNVVDLSSLAAIAGGTTFDVRIYGTGALSANGTLRIGDYLSNGTYYYDSITGTVAPEVVATPIPAAAWLFGSGLAGLAGIRRYRYRALMTTTP
jgi:hypothetical protein